jgi:DNA-binding transcriptional LysR family regulator
MRAARGGARAITLQQLRYFVAIAETSSFTLAARRLHVTQPALSHQIRALEAEMGAPLLDRSDRTVRLTPLGERVFRHALRAVEVTERIAGEAGRGRRRRCLRVGSVRGASSLFWPSVLPQFTRDHPEVCLEVHELRSLDVPGRLAAGDLDLAVAAQARDAVADARLVSRRLVTGRMVVCVDAASDLAALPHLRPADCRGQPLIILEPCHVVSAAVAGMAADLAPAREIRVDSVECAVRLVAMGLGIAVLPDRLTMDGTWAPPDRVRPVPLRAPAELEWSWVLMYPAGRPLSQEEAAMAEAIVRRGRELARGDPGRAGAGGLPLRRTRRRGAPIRPSRLPT